MQAVFYFNKNKIILDAQRSLFVARNRYDIKNTANILPHKLRFFSEFLLGSVISRWGKMIDEKEQRTKNENKTWWVRVRQ